MLCRSDVGLGAAGCQSLVEVITVVRAVHEKSSAGADAAPYVVGIAVVMSLTLSQFKRERVAIGMLYGMNLDGRAAARAPCASACRDAPRI